MKAIGALYNQHNTTCNCTILSADVTATVLGVGDLKRGGRDPKLPPDTFWKEDVLLKCVIAQESQAHLSSLIWKYLIILVCLGAGENSGQAVYTYICRQTGARLVNRLRVVVFQELLRKDMAFHDANDPAELASYVSEVYAVEEFLFVLTNIIRGVVICIAGIGAFFYTSGVQLG